MLNKCIALIFCIAILASCKPQESSQTEAVSTFNEQAETEAILKVIENETKCFFDGNYDCWKSNWSHNNYALQAWNNSDGTADAAVGWDKINTQGKNWIETYYKNGENIIHPEVHREKPIVKFFNETTAYLLWIQHNANQEKTNFRSSQEIRLMEKEADGWKIVCVTALWDVAPKIPYDSLNID
ncbi:MAG: hypothetical protein H6561_13330 [Lewinellaceae bacterium]|nr:hypothetical protein [Lewinellaceae bacterium]HPQ99395.1 hypothetical protein [Saprospiraceae bacterium]HQU54093.1 hypothetical protein [Saprospiraceae bacterium]